MAAEQQRSLGPALPLSGEGGEVRDAAAVADGGDDSVKAPRLPRWTRQEILVLIQGKRVAENRGRRGRGIGVGSGQVEPKWALVSSYCRRHGVNRGPVQCRKRWSNLSGDYKKIKEWEMQVKDESESFWVMRNDLRRERRLPGFFDREVYDILDQNVPLPVLALALAPAKVEEDDDGKEAEEVVFDSGRSAAAEEGLFSDFEQEDDGGGGGRSSPERETETAPAQISVEEPSHRDQDTSNGNRFETGSISREERKRKRLDDDDMHRRLIDLMETNSRLVAQQLQLQNNQRRLDREQRREQDDGFLNVLNKLADALGKMAEKL